MELLIIGLVAGGICGAGGKRLAKSVAKGYIVVAGKTKELVSSAQHGLRDTMEEARYELEEAEEAEEPPAPPKQRRRADRAANRTSGETYRAGVPGNNGREAERREKSREPRHEHPETALGPHSDDSRHPGSPPPRFAAVRLVPALLSAWCS